MITNLKASIALWKKVNRKSTRRLTNEKEGEEKEAA